MIGNISSVATASVTTLQRPDRDAQRNKMLSAVADKLGMSVDDLKAELDKGSTLNQIATAKGVSHDDLISTIESSISSNASAAGSTSGTSDAKLDQFAEKIASSQGAEPPKGAHRAHGGHRPPPPPTTTDDDSSTSTDSALTNVAKTLNMKADDLVNALKSGTSLESLAQQKGVSLGQVLGAVTKGMLLNVSV
ncbi:MAG: hypothetical protein JWM34_206 [Ilumatobacteraceae bacterium]|nr:hypothetical protein [Ilumatobacteraceae bacterium]